MVDRAAITPFVFLLALLASTSAQATENLAPKSPKAYKLEPKKIPEIENGKSVFLKGTTSKAGDRFYIEHLDVMQPVAITLVNGDKNREIEVQTAKFRWDEPLHRKSTKDRTTLQLRTMGELRIIVTSQTEGLPYHLAIWVGDEIKPDMSGLVVAKDSFEPLQSGGSRDMIIAGVGAAVFVVLVLVLWIKRKKTS